MPISGFPRLRAERGVHVRALPFDGFWVPPPPLPPALRATVRPIPVVAPAPKPTPFVAPPPKPAPEPALAPIQSPISQSAVISFLLLAGGLCLTLGVTAGLCVAAVVLLHELGHIAAMTGFGYSRVRMLFIPFFGGVAYGEKENATAREELLMLLAGPLPGLLVAWLIITLRGEAPSGPARNIVGALVFVNALNLLPLYPLDGGRIVRRVLFHRHPKLDHWFCAIAAAAGSAIALALGDWLPGAALAVISALAFYQLHAEIAAGWPNSAPPPANEPPEDHAAAALIFLAYAATCALAVWLIRVF